MQALGLPPALVQQAQVAIAERNATARQLVWPENWHAVCAFLDMSSQWRMLPMLNGVLWQGLDYSALPVVLAALKPVIPDHCRRPLHKLMPQLRELESNGARVKNVK